MWTGAWRRWCGWRVATRAAASCLRSTGRANLVIESRGVLRGCRIALVSRVLMERRTKLCACQDRYAAGCYPSADLRQFIGAGPGAGRRAWRNRHLHGLSRHGQGQYQRRKRDDRVPQRDHLCPRPGTARGCYGHRFVGETLGLSVGGADGQQHKYRGGWIQVHRFHYAGGLLEHETIDAAIDDDGRLPLGAVH